MRSVAERMRTAREKRRAKDLREIRLSAPDARSAGVRARIAEQVMALDQADEGEALRWLESISEYDNDAAR